METTTDRSLDFRRYLREMRRLWWVYAIAFVVIMGTASLFLIRSLKHCESSATVLIEESTSDTSSGASKGGGLMGMMKMFSVGGFGSSSVNNEIYLISAHDMAVRTVQALGLTYTYIERDGLSKKLLYPNSPVIASLPSANLDTLKRAIMIRTVIKPDGRINAKAVKGPFFWRTTLDEVKDATLPATLNTPYGPITLSAGNLPHPADENMSVDIIITGVDMAAHKLEKSIDTDIVDKLADAIDVSITGGSDEYCNTVLSEYINQYNKRRIERRAENATGELKFYDERIADLFSDLTDSEQKLEKFKTENKLVGMDAEAGMLVENTVGKMEDIVTARTTQEYYRMVKRTLENPSAAYDLIPVVESLGNPMIAKYNELLLTRKNLERSAKGDNPQLMAINDQIAELRSSILKNVDGMLTESEMRLNAMTGLMGTAQTRLNKMPAYEREYINLMRDRSMKNELYMFLLQKRENAALQVSSTSTLGFVIDPPHTPEKTSNKKMIIIILIALVLSFICPSILAVFLVKWRNRVEDPSDLANMGCEQRALVIEPDDKHAIGTVRTELLSGPSLTTVFVDNLADDEGNHIVSEIVGSLEKIGRKVNLINHLTDNDAILTPAFNSQLKSDAFNIVIIPESDHISTIVERINADDSQILIVLKRDEIRRPDLKRILKGVYADKAVTAIIR